MTRNQNRNPEVSPEGSGARATWRSYVAEVPAWFIVISTLSVSFWTQVFAVGRHDYAYWESLIWSASTDAGTLAFLFMAREDTFHGRRTWGAWVGSIACAFMSVQWNIVSAWGKGDILGVESHLWMPALALGTWAWLLHGRKRNVARQPEPEPEPPAPLPSPPSPPPPIELSVQAEPEPKPEPAGQPEPNGRERVTLARAAREYRKLATKGPVSGAALGRALGVSEVMGRNWKRKVEAEAKPAAPFRFRGEVAA